MVVQHPIICPYCEEDIGITQEELMFCVITSDIICPKCGKVVITANKVTF